MNRLSPSEEKLLRSKARLVEPIMRVGKNGLTPSVILQVGMLLDRRGLVKVKLLQSFVEGVDKREAAEKLAKETGSVLIDLVGSMVVLYKDKKRGREI